MSLLRSLHGFKTITAIVYKVCSFTYYFILIIIFYLYELGISAFGRKDNAGKESEREESENG
jgi:hypothetical protein